VDLSKIRKKIDRVDTKIINAFQERMKIVEKVTQYKIENDMEVLDVHRERKVVDSAAEKVKNPAIKAYVPSLYSTIMGISRKYQAMLIANSKNNEVSTCSLKENPQVGYLGIMGSFSYQAAVDYFKNAQYKSYPSFENVVDAVTKGEIDYAILPVENTSTGSVDASIDILAQKNVWILDEYILKVKHNLLGIKGAKPGDIKTAYSHHQAIKQCDEYLLKNKIFGHLVESTAHGAKEAAEKNSKEYGAIASSACGEIYGLNIIKENIQTNQNNYTKFVVIAKDECMLPGANKISVVATINHTAGSLHKLIKAFAENDVNLLKIVSRPILNNPWEYSFHLDFSGNLEDENVIKAIKEANEACLDIKILGCYRAYERME